MATLKITDENFDTEVLKSSKPIVVDFWAEWCGPCKMVGPILEEISDEMANDVSIAKHNIDEEPNTPTKYGVRGIPTMLLFKDGELKSTKVGATPKSDIVQAVGRILRAQHSNPLVIDIIDQQLTSYILIILY